MPSELVDAAQQSSNHDARQHWMKVLALSPADRLKALWSNMPDQQNAECEIIRDPERGLMMVRGRAGSAGDQFNLGEMTVVRCAVRLQDGTTGVSYIAGRDLEHALIAAKADAMMQSGEHRDAVKTGLIEPLEREDAERVDARAAKVAATRVNFFTMVRTREDKK